jgi:LPXTG-motif cell wall-anchored protein
VVSIESLFRLAEINSLVNFFYIAGLWGVAVISFVAGVLYKRRKNAKSQT